MSAVEREAELLDYLRTLGIVWSHHVHPPLFTVEDSKAHRDGMVGGHCKNMFLKAKSGERVLVTCLEDRQIRIRDLEKEIGLRRLSFGKPDLLMEVLGVVPGAVSPFAIYSDRAVRSVQVVLDAQMLDQDPLNYHPLHNAATIAISPDDLLRFIAATGHDARIVDFDRLEAKNAAIA
ncbi:MAG: prolyl-tRNA synthetase associated domain-containing protein [Pseudomonadota bacterium]